MFTSDIKAAFRNLLRNKVTSAISILGLAIGLGCIIILMALTLHERSFDRYIPGFKNIYRITLGNIGQTPYPLPETMAAEFPEVSDYFRYYEALLLQIRREGSEIVNEHDFAFADTSIFRLLGIRFLSGTPARSVSEVALSEAAAVKYFGDPSPVGSVLPIKLGDGFMPLTVSGVYKNFPSNSTLTPSMITDLKLTEKLLSQFQASLGDFGNQDKSPLNWTNTEFLSYVVLEKNSDPSLVAAKMEKYKEMIILENKNELHYRLQPVSEIYLSSEGISGNQFLRQGNPDELVYYEVISLLILIISLANFVLLTRAGVAERTMNIGTRKAFGASGGKIRRLIILESMIVVIISLVPASFIVDYGMKAVNHTLNKTLTEAVFLNPLLWILLCALIVLTGTISGWLIGLYYSKIPALELISGRLKNTGKSGKWNYSFLILHFSIYMVFVVGLIAVSKQIKYSETSYRGIKPHNILVSELTSDKLKTSYQTIRNELGSMPGVMAVAGGTFIPPFGHMLPINLATTDGSKIRFDGLIMGEGMTELLGMELLDGTDFGPYNGGTPEVLINESAAKAHNVRAGEKLLVFNVKGVLKDFNAHSLHVAIEPMVILQQNPERMSLIAVKTDGKNDEAIIGRMRELFNQISPDEIFEAEYLTERIADFYQREKNQARIIGSFAVLAAVLAIMGLFGISLISITRRNREIGLRKVNGATIGEVLFLVNFDFLKWVLISVVISIPISVFLINKWMERFAYRTEISWWIFALAGLSAVIIAVLTVSWQSLRAATRNPVEALRYE